MNRQAGGLRWVLLMTALFLAFMLGFAAGNAYAASVSIDTPQDKPKFSTEIEAELACIELQVRPRIMLPMTRQDLRVEMRVRRHADHRFLALRWDGGHAGAGGSSQQLRGKDEEFLLVRTIKNQPAAPWQFVAAVFDARGKLLGRDVAEIQMPEVER